MTAEEEDRRRQIALEVELKSKKSDTLFRERENSLQKVGLYAFSSLLVPSFRLTVFTIVCTCLSKWVFQHYKVIGLKGGFN